MSDSFGMTVYLYHGKGRKGDSRLRVAFSSLCLPYHTVIPSVSEEPRPVVELGVANLLLKNYANRKAD
jgi:hypothetical protein